MPRCSKLGMTNTGQNSEAASSTGEVNQNQSNDAVNQNAADSDQPDSAQDDKSDAA